MSGLKQDEAGWVTNPDLLDLVFALGAVCEGDEVLVDVKERGCGREKGDHQDASLLDGVPTVVTNVVERRDRGLYGLSVKHPQYKYYYISQQDIVAWRKPQPKETS